MSNMINPQMSAEERVNIAKRCTWIGFAVNGILSVLKIIAGMLGRSGAMIADGIHSASDFVTDVLVVVFFGFVPVGCTFLVMVHRWDTSVTLASLACGLVIDTLLMVNNFRDREQDALSGKRTLVVRFGARFGLVFYYLLGMAACWCCFYFLTCGKPWAALLPQFYLLPHILTTLKMARIHRGRELNLVLSETSRNMLLFGLLLTAGLVL